MFPSGILHQDEQNPDFSRRIYKLCSCSLSLPACLCRCQSFTSSRLQSRSPHCSLHPLFLVRLFPPSAVLPLSSLSSWRRLTGFSFWVSWHLQHQSVPCSVSAGCWASSRPAVPPPPPRYCNCHLLIATPPSGGEEWPYSSLWPKFAAKWLKGVQYII